MALSNLTNRKAILMARVEEAMRNAPSNKQYDLFLQRSGGREKKKSKLLKNGTATVFVAIDEKLISGGYAPGPHSTSTHRSPLSCHSYPWSRRCGGFRSGQSLSAHPRNHAQPRVQREHAA